MPSSSIVCRISLPPFSVRSSIIMFIVSLVVLRDLLRVLRVLFHDFASAKRAVMFMTSSLEVRVLL